jgi:CubicO group peptidase (beta-lactamase class C family)
MWRLQPSAPPAAVCLLAMSLAGPAPARAQDYDLGSKIDAYAAVLLQNHEFSGAFLIGTPDSVLAFRAYGEADYEAGIPVGRLTRFRIASLTKTFTAAAIAILADRGQLSLSDPLSLYLEDFAPAKRITLRHLLRHESGVADPDWKDGFSTSLTLDELVERITAKPLLFEPGTDGRYSNAGFSLLAYVVEQASGVPYDTFLAREIFEPLGMRDTRMVRDPASDPRHAVGYIPTPGPEWVFHPRLPDIGFSIGSGALSSTADDLYRWGVAIHRNRLFDIDAQIASDWPYGWGKIEVGDQRGIEQTGALQGYMSSLAVFDDGTIVVMLMNLENGRWVRIARDVAAIVFDQPYERVAFRRAVPLAPDKLERYSGHYESEDRFMDVEARDGWLWLYSDGWPVGKYLVPVSEREFEIPADYGRIRFADLDGGSFASMIWDFGESAITYHRSASEPPPR